MPKKPNLKRIIDDSLNRLLKTQTCYAQAINKNINYLLLRWISAMSVVEVYAIWERYAERRLVIALTNHPSTFLSSNNIKGMKSIPKGLANVIVREHIHYRKRCSCLTK